ncbi:hypothetical protein R3X27_15410 [Tropicimonas sp. TH_r6]|uniref:hypothetical protein n=1 Tax=Tropicimonas sp. TH_r6 TaxID=3082085 RepID=UPI0029542A76|nr:hypothetical protein [Tropicimonas sp. TH_r6]MDV7144076.1 hypothetical protein [Tropicimonas sp. TH_r6]
MTKHILDRQHSRTHSKVMPFAEVTRRTAPEGSNPAAKQLLRRKKGPMNASLRARAFFRIDRGYTV